MNSWIMKITDGNHPTVNSSLLRALSRHGVQQVEQVQLEPIQVDDVVPSTPWKSQDHVDFLSNYERLNGYIYI